MKRVITLLVALFATAAQAEGYLLGDRELTGGAYDLSAPIVQSRTALADAVAGQLVYDQSSGAFFGLPVGVSPTTASNWVQLSLPSGSNSVASGGTERIERCKLTYSGGVASCSGSAQSGTWVTSVDDDGAGLIGVNFSSSTFGGTAPTCVCTPVVNSGYVCTIASASSTDVNLRVADPGAGGSDQNVNLICMGAR